LSAIGCAGISKGVFWSVSTALAAAVVAVAAGCDVRPLQEGELANAADAAARDTRPRATGGLDGGLDLGGSASEVPSRRMLSGSVTDACTGRGTAARVGIAGRRQCSVAMKGSYYFDNLPEGNLALIVFKEGYKLYEVAVLITAEGTIQNIALQPDAEGGCADPLPADVACECDIPGCI
jgi:hypothetical protein